MDLEAREVVGRVAETDSDEATEEQVSAEVEVEPDPEEVARNERVARAAEHVRAESRAERLVNPSVFTEEPFSYTEEELAEVWDAFASDEQYVDIVRTADEHTGTEYLHAQYILSVPFAKLLLRTQANDPKHLIAEAVRENAELWPRPTPASFFSDTPLFGMTAAQVTGFIADIMADMVYADVKLVTASNGAVYLYSDRFMEEPVALRMAEWVEVDSQDMYNQ